MLHLKSFSFEESLKDHCRRLFRLLGIKIIVKGNLQPLYRQSVVIMPNHISYLDLPLLFGFLKVPMCGLEAHSHFKFPLYGKIISRIGNIPVDRRNPIQSFTAGKGLSQIPEYRQIIIFPEAGRSENGELMNLKRMPFQLVKMINRPILPVLIYGMNESNTKQSVLIFPGEIVIFVRPAIDIEQVKSNTHEELIQKTMAELTFAPFARFGSKTYDSFVE